MAGSLPVTSLQFEALGTVWQIDCAPLERPAWQRLKRTIRRRLESFEQTYSRFRADSLVSQISRQAGRYRLPADAKPLLELYWQLYQATNGKLTPLIGDVLAAAGYDASYSLRPGPLEVPPSWEASLDYRPPYLTTHRPVLLDLGAAGKGFAVDLVSQLLERAGAAYYCVDASGDLRLRYPAGQGLIIGLEHPAQPEQVIGSVYLEQGSLCGSATNRRRWQGYHHVIDPQLLRSPEHLAAVWVRADTAALADGLSTALFLASPGQLATQFQFEQLLLDTQLQGQQSAGFGARLFTSVLE